MLLVADREHRARRGLQPRAPGAGKELLGQLMQDVPLLGRGVLRLVQQHVLDAAVQLVEHPGGVGALGQQPAHAIDQVGEVEPADLVLGRLVQRRIGEPEGDDVAGVAPDPGRPCALADLPQSRLLSLQPVARGSGDLGRAHGVERCALVGREKVPDLSEVGGVIDRAHRGAPCGIALRRAGNQRLGGVAPRGPVDQSQRIGLDHLGLDGVVEAAASPDVGAPAGIVAVPVGVCANCRAAVRERLEHLVEAAEVELDREVAIGAADRPVRPVQRDHGEAIAGARRDQLRLLFLEHLEARRDAGFEREALQQRLAERVDGLDLQAAGRLQRAGEEAARPRQVARPLVQVAQGFPQFRVRRDGPFAQLGEQTTLHLRRRRFGVGDAKDGRRIGPAQQEPRDAGDQGPGLAGAGVRGDEGRNARVRRLDLRLDGDLVHASGPSGSPITNHSHRRARWS